MSDLSSPIVHQYEAIAGIARHMLDHARADRWDEVLELSESYRQAVEQLQSMNDLSTDDKLARRRLLTQILEDDAAIRNLAAPELGRLGHLLGNMKRQQSVLQAYCGPGLAS